MNSDNKEQVNNREGDLVKAKILDCDSYRLLIEEDDFELQLGKKNDEARLIEAVSKFSMDAEGMESFVLRILTAVAAYKKTYGGFATLNIAVLPNDEQEDEDA